MKRHLLALALALCLLPASCAAPGGAFLSYSPDGAITLTAIRPITPEK